MIPTPRLAALFALSLIPALVAIAWTPAFWAAVALDGVALVLFVIDYFRAPDEHALSIERKVEDVVSAGVENPVQLVLQNADARPLTGEVLDAIPEKSEAAGRRQPFQLPAHGRLTLSYRLKPLGRGDHTFGDLYLRALGPWKLAVRQHRFSAKRTVRAYPDLSALRDGVELARPDAESGLALLKRSLGEGREFESLRAYRPGDDLRAIDWKATARRQEPVTRQFEPERNQTVMLLIDCGRHMVSRVDDRTKLDYAIDAALRVARASLDRGDKVGLCAFGANVKCFLGPKGGRTQLRAMVDALYRLEPELVESDYAKAFDLVTSRNKRRALIATFTDLLDEDSSRALLSRTVHLRPRHLPLLIAVADTAVLDPARAVPEDVSQAYRRAAARKIVRERDRTVARLRDAGALVVSAAATELSATAVNEYLRIKARGLL